MNIRCTLHDKYPNSEVKNEHYYDPRCECKECKEKSKTTRSVEYKRFKGRIPNRLQFGQTTIKYPANSSVHQSLQVLAAREIPSFASDFGLGYTSTGYQCQTMELCGWVKRTKVLYASWEYRDILKKKIAVDSQEKKLQKAIGSYPQPQFERRLVLMKRKRVVYEITPVGREALAKMNEVTRTPSGPVEHPTRSCSGRTKGYKLVECPIYVDTELLTKHRGNVW